MVGTTVHDEGIRRSGMSRKPSVIGKFTYSLPEGGLAAAAEENSTLVYDEGITRGFMLPNEHLRFLLH